MMMAILSTWFLGSDDDFGMSDSEEEYDALEREQGNKFTQY